MGMMWSNRGLYAHCGHFSSLPSSASSHFPFRQRFCFTLGESKGDEHALGQGLLLVGDGHSQRAGGLWAPPG